MATNAFRTESTNDKQQYVAIINENGSKKVHVYSFTLEEAEEFKNKTDSIIAFAKDEWVTGSKKELKDYYKKINKKPRKIKTVKLSSKNSNMEWNLQMVKAQKPDTNPSNKVKVALIDSGIDYTSDIDVHERKNFITDQNDISIIYEDLCGHGTSVAGIIAAKDNGDPVTGINPNVELYSARVLDDNLSAPISRIVEAIYWAIEQNVHIISISFGTLNHSEVLHKAIQDAYNAGILIIAAAGNNGIVEYPAAYDEVIAVGSVDSKGERSQGSAIGDGLELVAPGELILSRGSLGGISVSSGTSMAVPHVVGIASALWEKDLNCSAEFIRLVLDISANQYGPMDEYGFGLVDYENALKQYNKLKKKYNGSLTGIDIIDLFSDNIIEENNSEVPVFTDVEYVVGSWHGSNHKKLAEEDSAESGTPLSEEGMKIVKLGAVAPDNYIPGMTTHPEWHGFTSCKPNNVWQYYSNYMSAYIYLTEIASAVYNGADPKTVTPTVYITNNVKDNITKLFRSNNAGIYDYDSFGNLEANLSWSTVLNGNTVNNRNKALFIYGMALHTASDMFAHSSYDSNGNYINHDSGADDIYVGENRYKCAEVMASYIIANIKRFRSGSISDYYNVANSTVYDGSFTLGRFATYAKEIDESYYMAHKNVFDAMTY